MVRNLKHTTVMGIDPAFRKSGFAVAIWQKTANTMDFKMFKSYNDFFLWLMSPDAPAESRVIVEDSNLQNATFDNRGSRAVIARKSRNVGTNQAVSSLTVDAVTRKYGEKAVKAISPRQKGKKLINAAYLDKLFKAANITLLSPASNQDKRDAAKLAMMKVF